MTKIVFITGASSGIGQACAEIFARQGYSLILAARRMERLLTLSRQLEEKYNTDTQLLNLDVRDKTMVRKSWESLPEAWRKVDVLINNAGLSQGLDPVFEGDTEDWDRMIDTNVKGLLYVSRQVLPEMKKQGAGLVINVGSIAGKEVYPNGNVYCASKHAVDALTKAMRIDLLPYGVKVSAIHPGAVETEFSEVRFKGDKDRAKAVYKGFEPLYAEDIAEGVWFMASRPDHVVIQDMLIMPRDQASGTLFNKKAE